jgi:hypothetical protein
MRTIRHTTTRSRHTAAGRRYQPKPRPRRWVGLALGTALVLGACTDGPGPSGAPGENASGPAPQANPNLGVDVALQPVDSCESLLGHLRSDTIEHLGAPGYPGGGSSGGFSQSGRAMDDDGVATAPGAVPVPSTTAPSAQQKAATADESAGAGASGETPAYSGTNNQVKGVDEADLTKTDGRRLFGIVDGDVVAWDLTGPSPRQVGRLRLETGGESQLLLDGDRLLVVSTSGGNSVEPIPMPMPTIDDDVISNEDDGGSASSSRAGTTTPDERPALRPGPVTVLTQVDVADLANPKVLRRVALEGTVAGARSIGRTARLAITTAPPDLPLVYPSRRNAQDAAEEANRRIVEETAIEDWLPQWVDLGTGGIPDTESLEGQPVLRCDAVSVPKKPSGAGMLAVLTVDLAGELDPADAVGVVGAGETVYASPTNLYATTTEVGAVTSGPFARNEAITPPTARTAIHRFGIDGDGPAVYEASGGVAGRLLNQFSMDEDGEDLRLATTVDSVNLGRSGSQSQVVVLRERDGELKQVGAVGGLGKGEQIKSVRFIDDVGYVVTFRQTDPLYTVDLSDPTNPKVAGELKILGYSAYLHPAGEWLLIGVGQDATATGRQTGTQVALFDVSNPAEPTQLQKYTVPGGSSTAEQDHHAFTWWPATNLAVLPVQSYGSGTSPCPPGARCAVTEDRAGVARSGFVGAIGLRIERTGITEVGRIVNPGAGVPAAGPQTTSTSSSTTTTTASTTTTGPDTPPGTAPASTTSSTTPPPTGAPPATAPSTTTTVDAAVREAARAAGNCDAAGNCPPLDKPTSSEVVAPPSTVVCVTDPCPGDDPRPIPVPPTIPDPDPGPDPTGTGVPILRIVVVGDQVLTLSETGLRSGHLNDLTLVAWEPLR